MARSETYMGLKPEALALVAGSVSEQYSEFEGVWEPEPYPLMKYTLLDGTVYYEELQTDAWASGPHFFIALRDHLGAPVASSVWSEDEIDAAL